MRSVCASGSRLVVCIAALLAGGCDRLHVSPGGDFAVRIRGASPIPAVGKISVAVPIAVTGCDQFRASVSGDSGSHPVDVVRDGGGWVVHVPVAFVPGQDTRCLRGADAAITRAGRLDVTCGDAGRTASAAFEISYATADVFTDLGSSGTAGKALRYLYPSGDPLRPFAVSPSWMQPWADLDPGSTAVPFVVDANWQYFDDQSRPRLVADQRAIFFTSGCDPREAGACPSIEVAPGVLAPSERIWVVNQDPQVTSYWWYAWVPQHVTDIGLAADGALVVVSHLPQTELGIITPYSHYYDTVVSRIPPGPPPVGYVAAVEVIGHFPTDIVRSRLSRMTDGRLAFLTLTNSVPFGEKWIAVLNTTDGRTVERILDAAAAFVDIRPMASPGALSLSPDASLMLAGNALGPPGGSPWTALPADHVDFVFGDGAGAVWGPRAVATWSGTALGQQVQQDTGIVEAFDPAPPNSRLFRFDVAPPPGSSGPAALHGVAAIGDRFVLTTNTGIRVLDRQGTVVGGSDPLPCLMAPSAVAIQSGPDQAAVGVGDHGVLVFDLSKL